jgi:uncharacterized protein YneF (UPF0154 family)
MKVGIIFPLSWPARIVFILIAIVLGLIFWMVYKPELWRKWLRKDPPINEKGKQ